MGEGADWKSAKGSKSSGRRFETGAAGACAGGIGEAKGLLAGDAGDDMGAGVPSKSANGDADEGAAGCAKAGDDPLPKPPSKSANGDAGDADADADAATGCAAGEGDGAEAGTGALTGAAMDGVWIADRSEACIKLESVRGSCPEPTMTVRESTAARPLVIVRAVASFFE